MRNRSIVRYLSCIAALPGCLFAPPLFARERHSGQDEGISSAVARPVLSATSESILEDAAFRLGIADRKFVLAGTTDKRPFAYQDADRIIVDRRIVALLRSPDEAFAFAAMMNAYVESKPVPLRANDGVSLGELGAGALVSLAGTRIDKVDIRENNANVRDRQALGWNPRQAVLIDEGKILAARTLSSLYKAGGCSAPLVSILRSMTAFHDEGASGEVGDFARAVMRDLGASVYPPDGSCLKTG